MESTEEIAVMMWSAVCHCFATDVSGYCLSVDPMKTRTCESYRLALKQLHTNSNSSNGTRKALVIKYVISNSQGEWSQNKLP